MVQKACSIQIPPPSDCQNLYFIVQELKIALAVNDHFDCFRENLVGKTLFVADEANPQSRQLPQIIIFNFSYGDIEFVFQASSEGFYYLSFSFEGEVIRQSQLDFTDAYIHSSIIAEAVQVCLNGFFLLGVAIAAIDRTPFCWLEGDLGLCAAVSAGYSMHLARPASVTAAATPSGSPALGAAAGIIL
jgi:hypothetical protein